MIPSADERFTELYEHHYASVLAYCGRRLARAEAEEVANEVFVVLWRRIDQFDQEQPLAWLYSVANKSVANRYRGEQRKARLHDRLFSIPAGEPMRPEDFVVRREQDRMIVEALTRLRPGYQQVLRLAAWECLRASGIAKVIGCSPAAAEQRLHRAKKRLAKVVSSSFDSVPIPAATLERPAMNADSVFAMLNEANPVPDPARYQQTTIDTEGLLLAVGQEHATFTPERRRAVRALAGWMNERHPDLMAEDEAIFGGGGDYVVRAAEEILADMNAAIDEYLVENG